MFSAYVAMWTGKALVVSGKTMGKMGERWELGEKINSIQDDYKDKPGP